MLLLAVAWWFGSTGNAFAYLDPGTGSILIQGIIGGVASGLFIMRIYWRKIKGLFGASTTANEPRGKDHRGR
jgi:hypothetical protein